MICTKGTMEVIILKIIVITESPEFILPSYLHQDEINKDYKEMTTVFNKIYINYIYWIRMRTAAQVVGK